MAGDSETVNSLITTGSCLPKVLSPLEKLCRDENKGVREKGVKALCTIGIAINEKFMVEIFVPVLQRLVKDGNPTGRASACTLLNAPYHTLSKPLKTQMHSAYSRLCRDSEPLVRQEAATNLWRFAATVDSDRFEHEVMSVMQHFMADGDECVRSSAIESCGALHSLLDHQVFIDYILPVFNRGAEDPSLRVRDMVANQMNLIFDGASAGILHVASVGILPAPSADIIPAASVGIGILPAAASAGNLPQMKEAKEGVSFHGVLGTIGVCIVLCGGVYFGVIGLNDGVTAGLKEGVTAGLKVLVGEVAKEIKSAREGWISEGCPALITVYLWKQK